MGNFAKGKHALAECQRSGQKMRYRDLVEDGHIPGLLVHPDWWEPQHPQEIPPDVSDPIALARPAPEISVPTGYGSAESFDGGASPYIYDTFDAATLNSRWVDTGLGAIYNEGTVGSGVAIIDPDYTYSATYGTTALAKDHYVQGTLKNISPGSGSSSTSGSNIYVWARASSDQAGDNSGYYLYLEVYGVGDAFTGVWLGLHRWDSPATYTNLQLTQLSGTPTVADGTTLRLEAVGNTLYCYYNGTLVFTEANTVYVNQPNIGFGIENYGDATGGFDTIEAGSFEVTTGTIAQNLSGDETQVAITEAIALESWMEWLRIDKDGGGYHLTRLADLGQGGTPTFTLRMTTAFSGTASSGNTFYLMAGTARNV